ncbi:hypothetical protein JB92DRAFT_3046462 [Gautieria morchelliformis]|nr:hypothetical protein JB92DRAFT_3046462 [Gautieria morchelliformis]
MAGIGNSSVAVTFSDRMDKKLKLGASFFCSDSCRDARLIVPTIARMLGRISPRTRSAICEVPRSNPDVAFGRSYTWGGRETRVLAQRHPCRGRTLGQRSSSLDHGD